jgi:hypothetical protein
MNPQLLSTSSTSVPTPGTGVRWVWKFERLSSEPSSIWRNFSPEVNSLLEERYQLYIQKLAECTSRQERQEIESERGLIQFKTNGISVDLDLKEMEAEWTVPTPDGKSDFEKALVGRMVSTHPIYSQKVLRRPLFTILMLAKEKSNLLAEGKIKRSEAFIRFRSMDFPLSVKEENDPPSFGIDAYLWTLFEGNSHPLSNFLPGLEAGELVLIPSYETSYWIMRHIERLGSMIRENGGREYTADYVSVILTLLGERDGSRGEKGKKYLPFLVSTCETLRDVLERMVVEGEVDQLVAKKIKDEHPSFLDTILD